MSWIPESRCFYFKVLLLNWGGHNVHASARISSSIRIYGNGVLIVGRDVWVGPRVNFYVNDSVITINDMCDIAPEVSFITGSHYVDKGAKAQRIAGVGYTKPIIIGAGSWLCYRSVVHAGVNLPDKSLISSNGIVK